MRHQMRSFFQNTQQRTATKQLDLLQATVESTIKRGGVPLGCSSFYKYLAGTVVGKYGREIVVF